MRAQSLLLGSLWLPRDSRLSLPDASALAERLYQVRAKPSDL